MTAVLKFACLLQLAFCLANSHFLPKDPQDPADALAAKMIKGAGIDSEPINWKKFPTDSSAPSQNVATHSRLAPRDLVKLQPLINAADLVAPKAWDEPVAEGKSAKEPEPSILEHDQKMFDRNSEDKELLHDMATESRLQEAEQSSQLDSQGDQSQGSSAALINQELDSMAQKEVVKVSHHDAIVHAPNLKSQSGGLANLGKSLDDYGPVSEEEPVDSSFSLHHGHYHPKAAPAIVAVPVPVVTAAKASVTAAKASVKVETAVTKPTASGKLQKDDLASSLAAHIEQEKRKELAAQPKKEPTETTTTPHADKSSVPVDHAIFKSVHRSGRAKPEFPIRPEDIHPAAAQSSTPASTTSTASESKGHPQSDGTMQHLLAAKKALQKESQNLKPSMPSPTSQLDDLFNANAVDGNLGADDVEKILRKMHVREEWNWHPFDLNGDNQLSRKEFLNAAQVAKRFRIHKKK